MLRAAMRALRDAPVDLPDAPGAQSELAAPLPAQQAAPTPAHAASTGAAQPPPHDMPAAADRSDSLTTTTRGREAITSLAQPGVITPRLDQRFTASLAGLPLFTASQPGHAAFSASPASLPAFTASLAGLPLFTASLPGLATFSALPVSLPVFTSSLAGRSIFTAAWTAAAPSTASPAGPPAVAASLPALPGTGETSPHATQAGGATRAAPAAHESSPAARQGKDDGLPPSALAAARTGDAYAQHAQQIVSRTLPGLSIEVAARLDNVLRLASKADAQNNDRQVLQATQAIAVAARRPGLTGAQRPPLARELNDAAREAFWTDRDVDSALTLQRRAFGANPRDAEVAGNLAFYHLKADPPQPEVARQLSLYALALATATQGVARAADWGNLAVASALSGQQEDARNAMLVFLAFSKDVNRACKAALSAVATHGAPMKAPAQAMLERVHDRGLEGDAPFCAWPPDWSAGVKVP